MKLTLVRKQTEQTDRRGRPQGVLFEFSCRVELDPRETGLVEKYARGNYPIGRITDRQGDPGKSIITIGRLQEGLSISTGFVSDAIETEGTVVAGCTDFKTLLATLESYGGTEELDL